MLGHSGHWLLITLLQLMASGLGLLDIKGDEAMVKAASRAVDGVGRRGDG
jgi:hypothetical protein